MDSYADRDTDGFVSYFRQTDKGLANQGWKDSFDSISHADGTLAVGPIALVEVQGYVYAARRAAARIARAMGNADAADSEDAKATRLQAAFELKFWCEDLGTYALKQQTFVPDGCIEGRSGRSGLCLGIGGEQGLVPPVKTRA